MLGIHSDSGHAWISIHDSEQPRNIHTVGGWPDVKAGKSERVAPGSDRRYDHEFSRTPNASRYKVLDEKQYAAFKDELSKPWKYDSDYHKKIIPVPQPNCATSAKDIWEKSTGETVNARTLGHDSPEKLSKSITRLEKKDPTGKLAPPLYPTDGKEKIVPNREASAGPERREARGGGALPRQAAPKKAKPPERPKEHLEVGVGPRDILKWQWVGSTNRLIARS